MNTNTVTRIELGRVLGLSQRRVLRLMQLGIFVPANEEPTTSPEEVKSDSDATSGESLLAEYIRIHSDDEHLTRYKLAQQLGISPNRVSELVKMGVLEPYSVDPLLYARDHSKACYADYQGFLASRKRGDVYAITLE
jgi:hypothetical protein